MDIEFAGATALEVIRRVRTNPNLELVSPTAIDLEAFQGPRGSVSRINFCALGLSAPPTAAHPAFLRVPTKPQRKKIPTVTYLVFPKGLPGQSILQLRQTDSMPPHAARRTGTPGEVRSMAPNSSRRTDALGESRGMPPGGALFDGHRVFVDCIPLACATVAARYQRLIKSGVLTQADATVRLVELIMEFTGHYGRDPENPRAGTSVENLPALVTLGDFRKFVAESRFIPGIRLLSAALQYAREGSRSAMETCLWIVATVPQEYGGYGFAGAKLNIAVTPTSAQRALMQHRTLTPDILWEKERVALEYQGFDEHASRAARAEDHRRMNDYQICGIMAFFVTFDEMRTIARLDSLARRIAEAMDRNGSTGERARIGLLLKDDAARRERVRQLAQLLPPVTR